MVAIRQTTTWCALLMLAGCGGGSGADAGVPVDGAVPPRVSTNCDPNAVDLTAQEQTLLDLPANSWWSAPNTPMVCPVEYSKCDNVVEAWSGGAFDANHNRMLIFGGGHADYAGNEVHAFDIGTMTWSQLTTPSSDSFQDQDPLPDNQPASRHSYDGLVYMTDADVFLAHGGSRWRDGGGTNTTWTMNAAAQWTDMQPTDSLSLTNCCSEGSAYDEDTGLAYYHITSRLVRYDVVQNAWTEVANLTFPPLWPRYEEWGDKVGLYDSSRKLIWFFGSGLYMIYSPSADAFVTNDWVTTGGSEFNNMDVVGDRTEQQIITGGEEVIRAQGPGVAYSKASDSIVAWFGGGPWILDLRTKSWSQGSSVGAPVDQVMRGTYGRWRYIERTNVFVLVNERGQDVHFYKHTAGCGGP